MAVTVNVHDAKTNFSKLLAKVSTGQEIIIAKAGKPVAKLSPIKAQSGKKRIPGIDKGKIWMAEDFNKLSAQEFQDWYKRDSKLN